MNEFLPENIKEIIRKLLYVYDPIKWSIFDTTPATSQKQVLVTPVTGRSMFFGNYQPL